MKILDILKNLFSIKIYIIDFSFLYKIITNKHFINQCKKNLSYILLFLFLLNSTIMLCIKNNFLITIIGFERYPYFLLIALCTLIIETFLIICTKACKYLLK